MSVSLSLSLTWGLLCVSLCVFFRLRSATSAPLASLFLCLVFSVCKSVSRKLKSLLRLRQCIEQGVEKEILTAKEKVEALRRRERQEEERRKEQELKRRRAEEAKLEREREKKQKEDARKEREKEREKKKQVEEQVRRKRKKRKAPCESSQEEEREEKKKEKKEIRPHRQTFTWPIDSLELLIRPCFLVHVEISLVSSV